MNENVTLQDQYELKIARERLQTICAQTESWLWETDENHQFSYFSENIEHLTGLTPDILLGTSRLERAQKTEGKNWQDHARDLAKNFPFKDFRYDLMNDDGEIRHLIITGWPLLDEEGKFIGYRGTGWDETDAVAKSHRQNEKEENLLAEIESQRANLATVLDNLTQSVMWFDKSGFIKLNNAQTAKLLDFEHSEYSRVVNLTQHLTLMAERGDFGDVDIKQEVEERRAGLCSSDLQSNSYRIHLEKSDRFLDVNLRPLPDGSRILTHTDVTREARQGRELSEREAMLSTVLNNIESGTLLMDSELNVEIGNDMFTQLWGMDSDYFSEPRTFQDIMNHNRYTGFYPADGTDDEAWGAFLDKRIDLIKEGNVKNLELVRGDGKTLLFSAMQLPGGKRMTTYFDVTILKEREAALEAMQHDLAQANELLEERVEQRTEQLRQTQDKLVKNERQALLGDLVASLCHELRNPLNALNTSLFLIRRTVEGEFPKMTKAFDRSERTIKRCTNILTDLYDYALVDDLRKQAMAVTPWLRDVVNLVDIPKTVKIVLDIDNDLPACELDPDQLGSGVAKIIANAAQAISDNLEPNRTDPRIEIYAGDCGEFVEIIITDNGPGMDADVLDRALEPLYSTRGFGVGLGLPIAEQVIKRHGGKMRLDSLKGAGTTVTLWIPTPSQPVLKVA